MEQYSIQGEKLCSLVMKFNLDHYYVVYVCMYMYVGCNSYTLTT